MNHFSGCYSKDEIKRRFRDLCKLHHPDLGGDEETMKSVNLQYEDALRGEFRKTMSEDEAETNVEMEREVAAKVSEIIRLRGIVVELVGRWVWVTGDTYPVKDTLKAAQFAWAGKKRAWFWHKAEDSVSSRGKKTLEEIKAKYGSQILRGQTNSCLTA
jgi:hypothetical protein